MGAAKCLVINMENRFSEHHTQAMLDVSAICGNHGKFQGIVITNRNASTKVTTFLGDLKRECTVH